MKVLIADKFEKSGIEGLTAKGIEVVLAPDVGADGIPAAIDMNKPDVLVVRSTKVPATSIKAAAAAGVKLIVRAGAGVDNIDVGAATGVGIRVCNCPGMNAVAVAELTIGLLLACDRRIVDQTIDSRRGLWNKKEYGKTGPAGARGLKGSTLGVVGAGAIGRAVIRRALAFDMHVIVWSRSISREHAQDLGANWGGNDTPALLALAPRCDFITIHLPLAADTHGLIGKTFLDSMKPFATIINTSRGGVIDEASLRDAAAAKGLRAGLDVYELDPGKPVTEPGQWQSPTAAHPGFVCTHHIGASTEQSQQAIAGEVVRILDVYARSGAVENAVNE